MDQFVVLNGFGCRSVWEFLAYSWKEIGAVQVSNVFFSLKVVTIRGSRMSFGKLCRVRISYALLFIEKC